MEQHKAFLIVTKAVLADKRISATAKLLLGALNSHRNKQTGQCNPKCKTLARELGVARSTIHRALADLREAGLIETQRRRYTNSYTPGRGVRSEPDVSNCDISDVSNCDISKTQNETSGTPVSLLTEPYQLNIELAEHAHSDIAAASPKPPHRGGRGALFPLFWQCFVNAGIALNSSDEAAARHAFERFPVEEQERIGKWVIEQLQTVWRTPQFTPTPLNALRGKGWTRQAAPRIVPKPPTREQELLRLLKERRARGQR